MPNINFETLTPHIANLNIKNRQEQMTQPRDHPNHLQCGAYALVAATGALGHPPGGANETFQDRASNVYRQIGVLNPARAEQLVEANGYNSPAEMARVAIGLGLNVTVNVAPHDNPLMDIYPGERERCDAVVGLVVNVLKAVYAPPGPNETHLICVKVADGLHWLARGTDGNYYDPANGELENNWGEPTVGDALHDNTNYTFTGLWMVFSRN